MAGRKQFRCTEPTHRRGAQTELEADLQTRRSRTVPHIPVWLHAEHGIRMALISQVSSIGWEKLARGCGCPRPRHVQNNPAAAKAFRETLPAKLTALALPKDRPVRLWVQGEMRYGLHGFTRRVCGLQGAQPVTATKQVYQWGYLCGATGLELTRTKFLLTEAVALGRRNPVLPSSGRE